MPHSNPKHMLCHNDTVHKNRGRGANGCFSDALSRLSDDFYRNIIACLVRMARKMNLPREEGEDMAQEALLRAIEDLEPFGGAPAEGQLCAWLRRVAHDKMVDALRRRDRRSVQSLDALAVEVVDRKAIEGTAREERARELTVLLARLRREEPENCRLLCEHHLEERSIRELADETGLTENVIRCRIYRAMEKMRWWASESCLHGKDAT